MKYYITGIVKKKKKENTFFAPESINSSSVSFTTFTEVTTCTSKSFYGEGVVIET